MANGRDIFGIFNDLAKKADDALKSDGAKKAAGSITAAAGSVIEAAGEVIGNAGRRVSSYDPNSVYGNNNNNSNGSAPASSAAATAPAAVSGYVRVKSDMSDMSFELPAEGFDLRSFDTGAMEVEMCFIYGCSEDDDVGALIDDGKLIAIMVEDADRDPAPTVPCSVGRMTAKSDGWVKWRGENIRYYKFTDSRGTERWLVADVMKLDIEGTPLQKFLEEALDHAAETLTE